jgi:putative phage-type endonuclease
MTMILTKILPEVAGEAAQGTDAWIQARCGRVTASRIADLVARTKTGWSASRAAYLGQILAERLTGKPAVIPTTAPMRWGLDYEPLAKAAYAYRTDLDIEEAPFILHPAIPMSGASPDGLIGSDGLIEIKCPTTITHIDTLAADEVPSKHISQIQWQMACTGRSWCDFVSFDPRLPEDLKLFVRRIERDEAAIADLQGMVQAFLEEVDARLSALILGERLKAAA